jgi:serine/threonine-protein kinase HipA
MARVLWGKVYFDDIFAGFLGEEPGGRYSFEYDPEYLRTSRYPLSVRLPLQSSAFVNENGLHPYFDNLISEGWLAGAQSRLLGKRSVSRFELLLAFGFDCIGAVSIIDPQPDKLSDDLLIIDDPREVAVQVSRASLSGVQAKIALVKKGKKYLPATNKEISTHIAKFPSSEFPDLVENEYLTSLAFRTFLFKEDMPDLTIDRVEGVDEKALIIERFDRKSSDKKIKRIHFEEYAQLLGIYAEHKYEGDYGDMARFILNEGGGSQIELFRLFQRIVVGFILGNTDMHFKNFAMIHQADGLRLAPVYDQVCSIIYGYKNSALAIGNARNLRMTDLNSKHILQLGESFNLPGEIIADLVSDMKSRLTMVRDKILSQNVGSEFLRKSIAKNIEKQWKISFASIGKVLSKRQ